MMNMSIRVYRFIASTTKEFQPTECISECIAVPDSRRECGQSRTSVVAIAITLLIVTWTGSAVLAFFGINVDSLRAAGGVIVLIIGLHMLFNKSEHKQTETEREDAQTRSSIAVVPIAIPIVAGPGTMATVLVAAQQHETLLGRAEISTVVIALSALIGLLFSFSRPISRWLGESGLGVVTRVMGVVLAAIAMGMLADGLKALLPGLAA